MKITEYTDEMLHFYILRTRAHLYLVRKWSDKIASFRRDGVCVDLLNKERDDHDQSKFEDLEKIPYIWTTWNYQQKRLGVDFDIPLEIKDQMNQATFHHIKTNKHHPEYWDDDVKPSCLNTENRDKPSGNIVNATKMPLTYIAAMCADWFAMSEELSTDPKNWADSNINIRWRFTDEQISLIYELIEKVY